MKYIHFALIVLVFIARVRAQGATEIAVYGSVLDPDGKPIGDVIVDISVPQKGIVQSVRTSNTTGRYVFRVDPAHPFSLMFTHERYHLIVVDYLTHYEHQHVSQTLYLKSKPLPPTAGLNVLRSYERALVTAAETPGDSRQRILAQTRPEVFKVGFEGKPSPILEAVLTDARTDVERLYTRVSREP